MDITTIRADEWHVTMYYNMHQTAQCNALAQDANVCMAMQFFATRHVLCRYSDTC